MMSSQSGNLVRCPACLAELEENPTACRRCGFDEIEDADFLSESDMAAYRQRVYAHRSAWTSLESTLFEQLQKFGADWSRLENWNEIWVLAQPLAAPLGFNWDKTFRHARDEVWERVEEARSAAGQKQKEAPREQAQAEGESTPQIKPEYLERVRQWVAGLPAGEVEVGAWLELLDSFENAVDSLILEDFRDVEIQRQFDSFEMASVDASGNLSRLGQRRVKKFIERLDNRVELVMLKIPPGSFQMGADSYRFEQPAHPVEVNGFYLGKHPVTQAQWRAVARLPKVSIEIGEADSYFEGDDLPAECVSWAEAEEFCARLSKKTGHRYRLPSEAEWEYACRAGSSFAFAFGPTITPVISNYDGNYPYGNAAPGISRERTVPVGSLPVANGFGLCDMHGNVCEWCADEWHDTYTGAPADGSPWFTSESPAYRVTRGGSWVHAAEICRSSDRSRESADPDVKLYYLGLRVALDL